MISALRQILQTWAKRAIFVHFLEALHQQITF